MSIKLNARRLKEAVNTIYKLAPADALPIMNTVWLVCTEDDRLALEYVGPTVPREPDIHIRLNLAPNIYGYTFEPIGLDLYHLHKALRCAGGTARLDPTPSVATLSYVTSNADCLMTYKISHRPPAWYKPMPATPVQDSMPGAALLEPLTMVADAAHECPTQEHLYGVYIHASDIELQYKAINGHFYKRYDYPATVYWQMEQDLFLSLDTVRALKWLMAKQGIDHDKWITTSVIPSPRPRACATQLFYIQTTQGRLVLTADSKVFPNENDWMKKLARHTSVTFNGSQLRAALGHLARTMSVTEIGILLDVKNGYHAELTVSEVMHRATASLAVTSLTGAISPLLLNIHDLQKAICWSRDEEVTLKISHEPHGPVQIILPDHPKLTTVTMPLKDPRIQSRSDR